jgi:hypothetical protein
MKSFLRTVLFLLVFILGSYVDVIPADSLNSVFANRLKGRMLKEERLTEGMTVPLHSVILAPAYQRSEGSDTSEAIATIYFNRNDLTREFLQKFFDPDDAVIRVMHLFASRGVETVLTKDKLLVTLHPGIALHLRNDVQFYPDFRTFREVTTTGTVTYVKGEFLVSRDQGVIMQNLADVWTLIIGPRYPCILGKNCFKAKDGSYYGTVDLNQKTALPPYFPPRVEE